MRMSATVLALMLAAPALAGPPPRAALNRDGMGDLQIGMSEAEALKFFDPVQNRQKPEQTQNKRWRQCHMLVSQSWPGLMLMIQEGVLTRISVWPVDGKTPQQSLDLRTDQGIGFASTEAEVRAVYDPIRQEAAPYAREPAHELYYEPRGRAGRGLRFSIDANGKVRAIYAGGSSIGYAENCE